VAQRPEGQLSTDRRRIPVEHVLAIGAKLLSSTRWVSGRNQDEAWAHSVVPRLGRRLAARVAADVNEVRRTVTLRHEDGTARTAVFHGDQGSVICTADGKGPSFDPVAVDAAPVDHRWEIDLDDNSKFEAALDAAFEPEAHTAAVVVVHEGRLVAERYAPGIDVDTQLESWSMGKSIAATLIGMLIGEGALALDEPPPIAAWQVDRNDPRAAITVRQLLQMSSGLRFSGVDDWDPAISPVPDHVRIYMDAVDAHDFAISSPSEHPPGKVGRYRNCDPLVLMAAARGIVEGRGDEWLTWPQRALFDRVGIQRQVLETDRFGNFLITGFDYGTARNWARLGLLYLGGGFFAGERMLPEGWTEFVATPAPAWEEPVYGGLFWLNRTREWALPESAFCMAGDGNQRCFVVPSHDLVVVRLGHTAGTAASGAALDKALALMMEACPS